MTQPFLEGLRYQQLFFTRMHRGYYRIPGRPRPGKAGSHYRTDDTRDTTPAPMLAPVSRWTQHLDVLAQSRGWGYWVKKDVNRALVIALSNHTGDDKIRPADRQRRNRHRRHGGRHSPHHPTAPPRAPPPLTVAA